MKSLVLAITAVLASPGCNRSSPPEIPAGGIAANHVAETSADAPSRPVQGGGDLDGDGKTEDVSLEGRTLTIGTASVEIPEIDEPELEIIDLDKSDKQREVAVVDPGLSDDATYHVYVYRAGKITHSPVFTGNLPEIRGDGALRVTLSNCGETTTQAWGLDGAKVVKKSEKKEGKFDDAMCAACPFVYVFGSRGPRFAGEILRWQRGPETYALQSLALDANDVVAGRVRVRIAERKPETTYLDAIHLVVGGRTIEPEICAREHAPCAADATMAVIAFGEHRDFVFETGDVAPGTPVELQATGFYVPH